MSVSNVSAQHASAHSQVDSTGELSGSEGINSNAPNGLVAGINGITNSLFTEGLSVLYNNMDVLQDQANDQFKEMSARQADARGTHEMSARIGDMMKQLPDNEKSVKLPPDIVKYMQQANMTVAGMPIDEYLKKYKKKFKSGQLGDIQASLDAKNSEDTDYAAQQQLKIQKMLQTYNVTVSLINAMQTLLSEMNKNIASNIR
ncbi:secretion protein EspA [Shewanella sp. OPT22]|nr:secretion protein EspA [Shewanella sp. OPT22]